MRDNVHNLYCYLTSKNNHVQLIIEYDEYKNKKTWKSQASILYWIKHTRDYKIKNHVIVLCFEACLISWKLFGRSQYSFAIFIVMLCLLLYCKNYSTMIYYLLYWCNSHEQKTNIRYFDSIATIHNILIIPFTIK